MRARARPILSDITPKNSPPNPEAIRVTDARPPADAGVNLNSFWIALRANAYSITSMPSRAHPAVAAKSTFHCNGVGWVYQRTLVVPVMLAEGSHSGSVLAVAAD